MFEKIKDFMGISDLEYEDEEYVVEKSGKTQQKGKDKFASGSKNTRDYRNTFTAADGSNANIMIVLPEKYEDCPRTVDYLKNEKTVVINLSGTEEEIKKEIFEFIKGAVYALNANIQKVSDDIFVIAPENIKINGKLKINVNNTIF